MSVKILSGYLKGSRLVVPDSARPTLLRFRQSVFDVLTGIGLNSENSQKFFKNKVVLDCFAGSGALGIEALSRGANFSYFVDISQNAIDTLYVNIKKLNLEECCRIFKTDILKMRKFKNIQKSDLVFIDPPYGKVSIKKTINHLYDSSWIDKGSWIVTEEGSSIEDLSDLTETIIKKNFRNSFFRIMKLK